MTTIDTPFENVMTLGNKGWTDLTFTFANTPVWAWIAFAALLLSVVALLIALVARRQTVIINEYRAPKTRSQKRKKKNRTAPQFNAKEA